jgi:NADPH:quinone reductase-like Zn-dependent oxidoreductase
MSARPIPRARRGAIVQANPPTMKAIRIHTFGDANVLTLDDVEKPQPGAGEILIEVHAAGINPVDYKMRSGTFNKQQLKLPLTLGRDVAGRVVAIGPGVRTVGLEDDVYAYLGLGSGNGGYAQFAIAKENEAAAKPNSLSYVEAAAVPLAATTAWQGLFDIGKLAPGERVLVQGAPGGVGHFAVQFAKLTGAWVVATGSGADLELLRRLGADEAIDYRQDKFDERGRDIDLVLDLVGGDTQQRSWKVVKDGGRIVSTLQQPSSPDASTRRISAHVFMAQARRDQLEKIAHLIDDRRVHVVIDQVMPLADARRAHDHMENDHIRGKVVLEVAA